jgi:multidrug resistance protein, MATE family
MRQRRIWEMSWPLMLTWSISSLIGLTDMLIAGRCGGQVQAAVGIGEQVIFFSVLLGTALSLGTAACVARCQGAGRLRLAHLYASDSLVLALGIGALAAAFQFLLSNPILHWINTPEAVLPLADQYLKLSAFANLPFVAAMSLAASFRALNKPKAALILWIIIATVSIAGSYLPVVLLSMRGDKAISMIALSWDVGASLGVLWAICIRKFHLRRISQTRLRELVHISLPTILAEISWIASNTIMFFLLGISADAITTQAALSLALKIEETFASMPLAALSVSAGTLVGQSLGAEDPVEAKNTGWLITIWSAIAMLSIGLFLATQSHHILPLLSSDGAVRQSAHSLLIWSPVLLPACAFWLIPAGCVEGSGCTVPPMIVNAIGFLAIRVPGALAMLNFGAPPIVAVCFALAISRIFLAVASVILFQSGTWALCGLPRDMHKLPVDEFAAAVS